MFRVGRRFVFCIGADPEHIRSLSACLNGVLADSTNRSAMTDASANEARQLLANVSYCDDCAAWTVLAGRLSGWGICAGLTDPQGHATGLSVDLRVHSGRTSMDKIYVFSVFTNSPYDTERVYQLSVNQVRRQLKAVHQFSHEHVGNLRIMGTADWSKWSYHQVLAYFCAQTNIVFRPPPPQPFQPYRRKR
jgi:hypothetical protein